MLKKIQNNIYYKKFLCYVSIVLISLMVTSESQANCIPANHDTTGSLTSFVSIFDSIVGIISDLIFGPRVQGGEINFANRKWEQGTVYAIFTGITNNLAFKTVFYLSVIFYISFLGVQFAVGSAKVSANDLLFRYLKIALIVFFFSPAGWQIYLDLIVSNILETTRWMNRAITASMYNVSISEVSSPFEPIDMIIGVITSSETWIKVGALFWSNGFLFTIMLLVIFLYVIVMALIVLAKVILTYISLLTLTSILLSIGPIFVLCALFEKTKSYFQNWIKNLLGLFFEQYLLFLSFFLFCLILSLMIKALLAFEICKGPVIEFQFIIPMPDWLKSLINGFFSAVSWLGIKPPALGDYIIRETYVIYYDYRPVKLALDIPSNIFTAAGIFIVASMFIKFLDGVSAISKEITSVGGFNDKKEPSNPFQKALTNSANKITSDAMTATASVASGYAAIAAPNYLKNKSQELSKEIAMREKNPSAHKGFFGKMATKSLKLRQKTLSGSSRLLGSDLTSKLVQTDHDLKKLETVEDIKLKRHDMVQGEIADLVGKNKKYQSDKDIPIEERNQILKKVDANIASKIANDKITALSKNGTVSETLKESIMEESRAEVDQTYNQKIYKTNPLENISKKNISDSYNQYKTNRLANKNPDEYGKKSLPVKLMQEFRDLGNNASGSSTTPDLDFKKHSHAKRASGKMFRKIKKRFVGKEDI